MTSAGRVMNRVTIRLGKKLVVRQTLFKVLTYTWGLLGTILGWFVFLFLKNKGSFTNFFGVKIFEMKNKSYWAFTLGSIIFTSSKDSKLLLHEIGHTYQNAIFGPFMIFVLISSVVRFWIRKYLENKKYDLAPYDNVWFEKSASMIGKTYLLSIYGFNNFKKFNIKTNQKPLVKRKRGI